MKPPTITTLKKFVGIVVHLKENGLEAMKDVTYGGDSDNMSNDRKALDHKRVTQKSLSRESFQALSSTEQEVYIYRLAR